MRTLPNRWPASAPRSDYVAECSTCGCPFPRSKLRRNKDGWLLCSRDWERGPAELNAVNAARAARSNPVRPGDGGAYHIDAPYTAAVPAPFALPTLDLAHLWVPTSGLVTSGASVTSWTSSGGAVLTRTQGTVDYAASSATFGNRPTVTMVGGASPRLDLQPVGATLRFLYDGTGGSVVLIARAVSTSASFTLFSNQGGNNTQVSFSATATNMRYRVLRGNTPSTSVCDPQGLVQGGNASVYVATYRQGQGVAYHNGREIAGVGQQVPMLEVFDLATARWSGAATVGPDLEIALFAFYTRVISQADVWRIQQYANQEWGVSL